MKSKLVYASFVLTTLGAVLASCASTHLRLEQHYRDNLALALRLTSSSPEIGKSVQVLYTLRNVGVTKITACLSGGKSAQLIDQHGNTAGLIIAIDHPYCEEQLTLAPGEARESTDTIALSISLSPGRALLSGHLELVDPSSCVKGVRCLAERVSAPLTELELLPPPSPRGDTP